MNTIIWYWKYYIPPKNIYNKYFMEVRTYIPHCSGIQYVICLCVCCSSCSWKAMKEVTRKRRTEVMRKRRARTHRRRRTRGWITQPAVGPEAGPTESDLGGQLWIETQIHDNEYGLLWKRMPTMRFKLHRLQFPMLFHKFLQAKIHIWLYGRNAILNNSRRKQKYVMLKVNTLY